MTRSKMIVLNQPCLGAAPAADLLVSVVSAIADRHRVLVEAEGFEFAFAAQCSDRDVWISFEGRSGRAAEVFRGRETEIRAAVRQALRARAAA